MRRGFKALVVLAAVAITVVGPQLFAFCDTTRETYAIFGCADRAYIAAPPAGSGAVSGVFWSIGFGNGTLNTGGGLDGTAFNAKAFNGNDSGTFAMNILDAAATFPTQSFPPGSLCLGSNNWGNSGVDGCCDHPRDTSLPFNDDDLLNPAFDVEANNNGFPGVADTKWVQDAPLGVLLTEGTGHYFALAAVASVARTDAFDVRQGFFRMADVSNGGQNAMTAANNVVLWQSVPGNSAPLVRAVDPNSSPREVDLGWHGVKVYSDQSTRPSTNAVVNGQGLTGMGTADQSLLRYVIEQNDIDDPNNPVGGLDPNGWTSLSPSSGPTVDPNGDVTAHAQVPVDTCLRLRTYFGAAPQATPSSTPCRQGLCGDLGYGVVSAPSCIGGALAADGVPRNAKALRGKGGVDLTFETSTELQVRDFTVYALTPASGRQVVATLSCKACTNGEGAEYSVRIPMGQLKGARDLEIEASTGASAKVAIK